MPTRRLRSSSPIRRTRNNLYRGARLLGDIDAVMSGKGAQRYIRKVTLRRSTPPFSRMFK